MLIIYAIKLKICMELESWFLFSSHRISWSFQEHLGYADPSGVGRADGELDFALIASRCSHPKQAIQ